MLLLFGAGSRSRHVAVAGAGAAGAVGLAHAATGLHNEPRLRTSIDAAQVVKALLVWAALIGTSTFVASRVWRTVKRRVKEHRRPAHVDAAGADRSDPSPSPESWALHTPAPVRHGDVRSFVCDKPLPDGITLRSATLADRDALLVHMRTVATQRGGLAREVDEVTPGYISGMLEALDGGVMVLAVASPAAHAAAVAASSAASSSSSAAPASPSSPVASVSDGVLVGVLKASRIGPHRCFRHVLSDCTLAVHPDWQRRALGQHMFAALFATLAGSEQSVMPGSDFRHVLRVELIARESNQHALRMYEKVGFRGNARLHSRIVSGMALHAADGAHSQPAAVAEEDTSGESLRFESDVVMVYFNPAFERSALAAQFAPQA